MTVHCQIPGCGMSWPKDPVMTVRCPTCGAEPGRPCRQPSGHGTWNVFGRFHASRDIHADQSGAYGPEDHCPKGLCGHANIERRRVENEVFEDGVMKGLDQKSLFEVE